jgi:hypothetical protein
VVLILIFLAGGVETGQGCKCLRIGEFGCGFWLVERGGLVVNRGDLRGFCVVTLTV